MTKLFSILLLFSLSFSASAEISREELDRGAEQLIEKLNLRFGLDVKIKLVDECGFSAHEDEDDAGNPIGFSISYCDKDINYFTSLKPEQAPVESLLTILGHEFAHFLLDYDIGAEAQEKAGKESQRINKKLLSIAKKKPGTIEKLKKIISSWENDENASQDELLLEAVDTILMTGTHENVDSLSTKLLDMMGYESVPEVISHMPAIIGDDSEDVLNMVKARLPVLQSSKLEGARSWNNFVCVTPGRELEDFNPLLKKVLAEDQNTQLIKAVSKICSDDEIEKHFFRILNSYYP